MKKWKQLFFIGTLTLGSVSASANQWYRAKVATVYAEGGGDISVFLHTRGYCKNSQAFVLSKNHPNKDEIHKHVLMAKAMNRYVIVYVNGCAWGNTRNAITTLGIE